LDRRLSGVNVLPLPCCNVNALESLAYVALGFLPTLGVMEMSWRMGRAIRKRGTEERRVVTGARQ
jgi:hypothetical protein